MRINDYYDEVGMPLKCQYCESKNIYFRVTERIEYTNAEELYYCEDCSKEVGYWAYGYWNPYYREQLNETINNR